MEEGGKRGRANGGGGGGKALRKGREGNGEVLCIWMSSVLTTWSMLA